MAIDKQLPSWFLDIDRESDPQNPRKTLWFIFGVTCMAPLFGQATLIWFINAGGLGVVVAYIFVTVSFLSNIELRTLALYGLLKSLTGNYGHAFSSIIFVIIVFIFSYGEPQWINLAL